MYVRRGDDVAHATSSDISGQEGASPPPKEDLGKVSFLVEHGSAHAFGGLRSLR